MSTTKSQGGEREREREERGGVKRTRRTKQRKKRKKRGLRRSQ